MLTHVNTAGQAYRFRRPKPARATTLRNLKPAMKNTVWLYHGVPWLASFRGAVFGEQFKLPDSISLLLPAVFPALSGPGRDSGCIPQLQDLKVNSTSISSRDCCT